MRRIRSRSRSQLCVAVLLTSVRGLWLRWHLRQHPAGTESAAAAAQHGGADQQAARRVLAGQTQLRATAIITLPEQTENFTSFISTSCSQMHHDDGYL